MTRAKRVAQRTSRRVHRSTEPFLDKPKTITPPARNLKSMMVAPHNWSMLSSIGEGSASDGLEILCDAFRGGLKYLKDGRRRK